MASIWAASVPPSLQAAARRGLLKAESRAERAGRANLELHTANVANTTLQIRQYTIGSLRQAALSKWRCMFFPQVFVSEWLYQVRASKHPHTHFDRSKVKVEINSSLSRALYRVFNLSHRRSFHILKEMAESAHPTLNELYFLHCCKRSLDIFLYWDLKYSIQFETSSYQLTIIIIMIIKLNMYVMLTVIYPTP